MREPKTKRESKHNKTIDDEGTNFLIEEYEAATEIAGKKQSLPISFLFSMEQFSVFLSLDIFTS